MNGHAESPGDAWRALKLLQTPDCYSTEDLRATSGPLYRRVRATTVLGNATNFAIAALLAYLGMRFITG
jgi:hypothetical protein